MSMCKTFHVLYTFKEYNNNNGHGHDINKH